jgi:hypothetical protein
VQFHYRHCGAGLPSIHIYDQQRNLESGLAMAFAAV